MTEEQRHERREYMRAYREANRDKIRISDAEWRKSNKEKVTAGHCRYYETNRETIADRQRAYKKANKEKVSATYRAWREANREKKLSRDRLYNEANRDRRLARQHAYTQANKDKILAAAREYQKSKRNTLLNGAFLSEILSDYCIAEYQASVPLFELIEKNTEIGGVALSPRRARKILHDGGIECRDGRRVSVVGYRWKTPEELAGGEIESVAATKKPTVRKKVEDYF